jgi:PKD repeat protein
LDKWGSGGSGDGQFSDPSGVAVDSSGNVYVSDSGNNRIQKFSSNGSFLDKWGSGGSGDGQFATPYGVIIDPSGNLYAADKYNNRIQKFDSTGLFLTKWGSVGSGNGQFRYPLGVAIDSSSNVYVADSDNYRIQKFALELATNFTANVTSGTIPLTVKFTDTSTGSPTSWNWSFGDGSMSALQNPIHTYPNTGKFTVSLNVTNAGGSNVSTRVNYISVFLPAPIADFSATPTTGTTPITIRFTDASTNSPSSWNWSFGDGSLVNASVQHPVHTYSSAGTYTVSLNATNAGGSNTKTVTDYITVTAVPLIPVAAFTATPIYGTVPLTVTFTDNSTNSPTGWNWSFGDNGWFNTTNVLQRNPVHMYTGAGSYTISLTASNPNGTNTLTKTGYISVDMNQSHRARLIFSNVSLYQKTSTKIPVEVANITGGTGISFNLTYNPSVMQVNNITLNQSYASGSNLVVNSIPGLTRVTLTRTDGINIRSPTQIFLLDVTGIGVVGSLTQLFANNARWSTSDFDIQQFYVVNGTIRVYRIRGDLNGNGEVDIGDTAKTAYMVIKLTPDLLPDADFNNNGVIDTGDAAKIAWFSVGKIIEL